MANPRLQPRPFGARNPGVPGSRCYAVLLPHELQGAAALLMAIFWICESVPIPVTALLPLILFPALGLGDIRETAAPFANPVIYLFLGGFLIALAMQRWNLHRRVAINLIGLLGTRPDRLVGGFLLASAAVSMWVSNTATALMMLPIASVP